MNNGNWIKLNRAILDWEWYDDVNVSRVFIHLLLTANYEPKNWHGIQIERGQRVISIGGLAEETGLTVRQTRTALDKLKSTGELTSRATNKYTLVTIENYSKFQDVKHDSDKQNDKQRDKRTTNERQTNDNNIRNKEYKECKEERERTARKSAYGRKGKVLLTDEEYQAIKEYFVDADGLINHVGEYLANASKHYEDHDSLIWQIGKQDKWAVKRQTQTYELTQEEIDRMRTEAFGEGWKQ